MFSQNYSTKTRFLYYLFQSIFAKKNENEPYIIYYVATSTSYFINMEHVYREGVPQNLKIKGEGSNLSGLRGGGQMGLRIISILGLRIIWVYGRRINSILGLRIIRVYGLRIILI